MRILIYQKNKSKDYLIKINNLIEKIQNYKNIHVDFLSNEIKEMEYYLLVRRYSLLLIDYQSFLELDRNSLENYGFFTTILIIEDRNLSITESKELYESNVNGILNINNQLFFQEIFADKQFQLSNIIQFVNFKIDMNDKKVYIDNVLLKDIKGKMYEIFVFLIKNNGLTFTKEEIMNFIFDEPEYANENSIDTYLSVLKTIINKNSDRIKMNVVNKEGYNISISSNYKKKEIIYEI